MILAHDFLESQAVSALVLAQGLHEVVLVVVTMVLLFKSLMPVMPELARVAIAHFFHVGGRRQRRRLSDEPCCWWWSQTRYPRCRFAPEGYGFAKSQAGTSLPEPSTQLLLNTFRMRSPISVWKPTYLPLPSV